MFSYPCERVPESIFLTRDSLLFDARRGLQLAIGFAGSGPAFEVFHRIAMEHLLRCHVGSLI